MVKVNPITCHSHADQNDRCAVPKHIVPDTYTTNITRSGSGCVLLTNSQIRLFVTYMSNTRARLSDVLLECILKHTFRLPVQLRIINARAHIFLHRPTPPPSLIYNCLPRTADRIRRKICHYSSRNTQNKHPSACYRRHKYNRRAIVCSRVHSGLRHKIVCGNNLWHSGVATLANGFGSTTFYARHTF